MKNFQIFKDLATPKPLSLALEKMQFIQPTPVQKAAIPPALLGKDVLGTAKTGTGKTGAFCIPLLTHIYAQPSKMALILAPTRELAAQIHQVLRQMSKKLKMRGTLVVGGESFGRQVNELDRGVDYVVATPGRLIDHLQEGTIDLSSVSFLVLDEVDRMLDMGFAPQIKQIMRRMPKKRQTLLFSATLPSEIVAMASSLMRKPVRVEVDTHLEPVKEVNERVVRTTQQEKTALLQNELNSCKGKVLIFTRTKSRTDRVARVLRNQGFQAISLHGGKTQPQRKKALDQFRSGARPILVATDIAGRGIDVADIEHVINYDLPHTREDYIHRIGRTARLGKKGEALTFIVPEDYEDEKAILADKAPKRPAGTTRRRSFGTLRKFKSRR